MPLDLTCVFSRGLLWRKHQVLAWKDPTTFTPHYPTKGDREEREDTYKNGRGYVQWETSFGR